VGYVIYVRFIYGYTRVNADAIASMSTIVKELVQSHDRYGELTKKVCG